MPTETEIKEAQKWLETARLLLKKQGLFHSSGPRSEMKSTLKSIEEKMAAVKQKLPQPLIDKYELNFMALGSDAHNATDEGERVRIAKELGTLEKEIQADLTAFDLYKSRVAAAEGFIKELKTLAHGDKTYHEPIQKKLEDAAVKARAADFKEAAKELETTPTRFNEQKKQAETDRIGVVDDARHKAVYNDKHKRIEAAIKELEALPGTGTQVTALKGLLTEGDKLAGPGKYAEAYKKLSGLTNLLKAGRAAAESFPTTAGGPGFQTVRPRAEQALATYAELFQYADPDGVKQKKAEYTSLLKALEGTPDVQVISEKTSELAALAFDLKRRTDEALLRKAECETLLEEVDTLMRVVARMATPEAYEPLHTRYRLGQAQTGIQDHAQAKSTLSTLKTDLESARDRLKPDYDAWNEKKAQVEKDHLAELRSLAEQKGRFFKDLPESQQASLLHARFNTFSIEITGTRDFKAAAASAQAIIDAFASGSDFRTRLDAVNSYGEKLKQAHEAVRAARTEVEKALERLVSEGGEDKGFIDRCNVLNADFHNQADASVLSDSDLATVKNTITGRFGEIRDEIVGIVGDGGSTPANPEKLAESKRLAAARKALDAFDSAHAEAISALHIATRGDVAPDPAATRIDEALAALLRLRETGLNDVQTPIWADSQEKRRAHFEGLTAQVNQLKTRIQELEQQRTRTREDKRSSAGNHATAARKRVKALLKTWPAFEPYLSSLQRQVEELVMMSESDVTAVVTRAEERLSPTGDTGKLLDHLESTKPFEKILEKKNEIQEILDDSDFEEIQPARRAAQMERFNSTVAPEISRIHPDEALVKVEEFLKEAQADKDEVEARKDRRAEVIELVEKAEGKLGSLKDVPQLKADLKSKLKGLKTFTESCEYEYLNRARAHLATLEYITSTEPGADERRGQLEQSVKEQQLNHEARVKEIEGKLDVFDKNLMRRVTAVRDETPKGSRDTKRFSAIEDARKEAGKLHGKGLLDQALSKLEEAERLADGYMLNPFNAKAATGRGLQKANKSFKEAVFSFIRQVGELTKEIETAAEGDSTIVVANVVKPLKHLSTIFDPEKFDDTVDKVKGAETLTDVRVFKEQGLRFVRMYQDRLDKDPVLRLLGEGTPFQAQARIAPLRESLTGLELNFLRADAI